MSTNLTVAQKRAWLKQAAQMQGWGTATTPKIKKGKEEPVSQAIDEVVEKYLKKLHERNALEEQAKDVNEKCKAAKNDFVKIGQQINKILKDTKSDSIIIKDEVGDKTVQYIMLPNSDSNVTLKEVFTEKEIKTRQAVKKLSKKDREPNGIIR